MNANPFKIYEDSNLELVEDNLAQFYETFWKNSVEYITSKNVVDTVKE